MEKKDYFSDHAKIYAAFRPAYPDELYHFIFGHIKTRACAWDCGTGNGQVARHLAGYFDTVYATDISRKQLDNAFHRDNILYSVTAAEQTDFKKDQFDLITVAQALHWFDISAFYKEVKRTLKPEGLLAVWGYGLLTINPEVDQLFLDFYQNKTGPYWDEARKLVDNQYRDVPFPFDEIHSPGFDIILNWTPEQFCGYLTSWSATQKYSRTHGINPVDEFRETLKRVWKPGEVKRVKFPVFMKLGGMRHL